MKKTFATLLIALLTTGCFSGPPDIELTEIFKPANFGYNINYPHGWLQPIKNNQFTAVFKNEDVSIVIQNIATVKLGGIYQNSDEAVEDFKNKLHENFDDVDIDDEQRFIYRTEAGEELEGAEFTAEYGDYKEWQLIIPRPNGHIFYSWSYLAPEDQYDDYLETAKEMFDSWKIF